MDPLPLPAQEFLASHLFIRIFGVLDRSAQVALRAQHTGGLAAVLVIAQLILLLGPGGGDGLAGPPQGSHTLQPVPGSRLVVADILVGQHHGLSGPGMGHRVPHPTT